MAEYKYRALGWKDDDIASLNVVDGTAADNQVELQITKQGAGTIDGPAIVGKDGITIDKAADSEKIEISGSGCVQINPITTGSFILYGQGYNETGGTSPQYVQYEVSGNIANSIAQRRDNASLEAVFPDNPNDITLTNKKYVDDNYVKKVKPVSSYNQLYGTDTNGEHAFAVDNSSGQIGAIAKFWQPEVGANQVKGYLLTNTPTKDYHCANKKYVDDAVAGSSTTVDGISIVKDTDGKIQLNQEYIDYLDNQLYQPPAISVFTMLDAAGAALPTSNELGTTLSAAAFNHQETNIKNIQGDNVELHINNAVAATTSTAKKDVATKVTLTTAQSITSSTKFTLKGTNTKGAAFSRDYQVNFYRYAYTATTDATTAPTSGATQQAAVSTFASNGSTFNYTKGAYIYFYTDNTGKKVQTNVLGQWADVDTTDMGKVTLTQSNGATHEYTCYRIGPFIETGSAKYRV